MASYMVPSLLLIVLSCAAHLAGADAAGIGVYWNPEDHFSVLPECSTRTYDFVNLAFLDGFWGPAINLPGRCGTPPTFGGCSEIANAIEYCQSHGVKVLLSIGGNRGYYALFSEEDARQFAKYLWDNFLGGNSSRRPFGSVSLDGIDFDIEIGGFGHYDVVAKELARYSKQYQKVYLSAAPGCAYPDKNLEEALDTGLFDYVWVKFYDDERCDYSGGHDNLGESWKKWTSKANATYFFLGLPASLMAADSGYIPPEDLIKKVLPLVEDNTKYGGVMLWNRYFDWQNQYSLILYPYIKRPWMLKSAV